LDGDTDKRRPIIVVDPDPEADGTSIVIACSATAGPREADSVPMPNRSTEPQCSTGLPRPCSAIPRWFLPIANEKLVTCEYSGTLGGAKLKKVLLAYEARVNAAL
jgi:uncharacterized Zn-finger protein